eukprot:INCI7679.5.p1 GENE.INCI7679.5~~INCI7679.5.p1  ORF type:complete len:2200 (+),score=291.09 INCI7679.5:315-6602(+)
MAGADLLGGGGDGGSETAHSPASLSPMGKANSGLGSPEPVNVAKGLATELQEELRAAENGTKAGVHPKASKLLHSLYDIDLAKSASQGPPKFLPAIDTATDPKPDPGDEPARRPLSSPRLLSDPRPTQNNAARKKLSPIMAAQRSAERRWRTSPNKAVGGGCQASGGGGRCNDNEGSGRQSIPSLPRPVSAKTATLELEVEAGNVLDVSELVACKADINYESDTYHAAALVTAVARKDVAMVECLCKLRANPHLLDQQGQFTALQMVVDMDHAQPEQATVRAAMVQALFEAGMLRPEEIPDDLVDCGIATQAHAGFAGPPQRLQVVHPHGVAVRRRPSFLEAVDAWRSHPWLIAGSIVSVVTTRLVTEKMKCRKSTTAKKLAQRSSSSATKVSHFNNHQGGFRSGYRHDGQQTTNFSSFNTDSNHRVVSVLWVQIAPVEFCQSQDNDNPSLPSLSSSSEQLPPFAWVPVADLATVSSNAKPGQESVAASARPTVQVLPCSGSLLVPTLTTYHPYKRGEEYHEWEIHDVASKARGAHALASETAYIHVGHGRAVKQSAVECAHWMNVFEQSVWRQFIAEVNKHDQEERIKRDAIIRQRGLTALPNGMLAVAADIEMSPSKRLGLEQKTIPEALAQWLGVFQRRQSAEPNEYGELFERVPLSEVVYGENRHYVFRARIPEHLVPEFFAQKKLHELSLASWQHFKHTGDNAVRTLSVHTPSQCLGVLDSNVALNDSEDVENSSKPRHRHTRSEGASLPDKKQLSRNKLLQPLPDRSSNVLGSIVDSRPFIGSVSMLRKRIRDTSALPKDHPSARMPLPPQLRDAYERQGRLLDGQLVFDPRGKKESKAHRRGSSLPDHLVPDFVESVTGEVVDRVSKEHRTRKKFQRRDRDTAEQRYVTAFEIAHSTLEDEKRRAEEEAKERQRQELMADQETHSDFFGQFSVLQMLKSRFATLVASKREMRKEAAQQEEGHDHDLAVKWTVPGAPAGMTVGEITRLRLSKTNSILRSEGLLPVDVGIKDFTVDACGRQLGDRYMVAVAEALMTVKYLLLRQNLLTFQGLRVICRGLHKYNSASCGLLHLDLSHNRLGTHGAKVLARALSFDKSYVASILRAVSADEAARPLGGASAVTTTAARRMPILVSLRMLRLRDNGITEAGTDALCQALRNTKVVLAHWSSLPGWGYIGLRLSVLDLSRNEVGLPAMRALEKLVRRNSGNSSGKLPVKGATSRNQRGAGTAPARDIFSGLERLELSWCTLSVASATCLWNFVTRAVSLLHLDVSWNPGAFHKDALNAFCAMLESNKHLVHLNMANCSVTASAVQLRIAESVKNNKVLLGLHVHGNAGLHLDNFGFLHAAQDESGLAPSIIVSGSQKPAISDTHRAGNNATARIRWQASSDTADSESQVLLREEEAAQLSQTGQRSADNGWHATGDKCWLCSGWREVYFHVLPQDVTLPAQFSDNLKMQDTTDYMFRVYLCCEADGWKPVRMNRIPGQGFDLYRVLPQPPDYRSHAPTSGQHQHLLQRYFFLLRVVYFSKVENSDGSSSRLPDSQRPSERVHTSEGGTNQRVVLSFVKAGSTLHFEDGALVRGSRSNAASRSADAFEFSSFERELGRCVVLEFAADTSGEKQRETCEFPEFFHKLPATQNLERKWWGKELVDEAYDDHDVGLRRVSKLHTRARQCEDETSDSSFKLFQRADCHLSDAFEADWMHSKIGELLRARNKMIEISAIPTANKGSLIEDCRAVVPLPANSDVDVEADLIDLQTSLRAKFNDLQIIFRGYQDTSAGSKIFFLSLDDFLTFCRDIRLLRPDPELNPDQTLQSKSWNCSSPGPRRTSTAKKSLHDPPISLNEATLKRLFSATNITPDSCQAVHRNSTHILTRYEFMELIVRCALEVASRMLTGQIQKLRMAGLLLQADDHSSVEMPKPVPLAQALDTFWDAYVAPRARMEDAQFFRSTLMYTEGIHRILLKRESGLRTIFDHFAKSDPSHTSNGKAFLFWTDHTCVEFCKQLKRHAIISLATRLIRRIFLLTAPLAEDEVTKDRHRQLSFTEWLEILCRICDAQARHMSETTLDRGPDHLCEKTLEPFVKGIVDRMNVIMHP